MESLLCCQFHCCLTLILLNLETLLIHVLFCKAKQLTLKVPITTAADDIINIFFIVFFQKIRLDVLSEFSARQRIHMKNQALFSSKDKSKKLKCRLLQFLFGALRVK